MVFAEVGFLSVIWKDFLYLCGSLVLQCFLEACSIYSSIIETKEDQRLIVKVGSIILIKLVNVVHFSKEKAIYIYVC